jgi:hypothetical protein
MSDDIVPSLSSEEPTPAERPLSKAQQRRLAAQKAGPQAITVHAEFPVLDPGRGAEQVMAIVAEPQPKAYARWRVTEEQEVPKGASSFLLRREQVLSEQHYDVPALLAQGVKLERLPD